MPNVAREAGLAPNQGKAAEVAELLVAAIQVLPEATFRLMLKSTLPLLPAPGLLSFKNLETPLAKVPVPLV